MKQKKLISEFNMMAMILFISVAVSISLAVTYTLYNRMMNDASVKAFGYAHTVADIIDGDDVGKYIASDIQDEDYYYIQQQLEILEDNFELMYCYVYVPHEDYLTYVWVSHPYKEHILNEEDVYSKKGKECSELAFRKDPELKFELDSDPEYGNFMSAYVPIYDSTGEPVALAAADLPTDYIYKDIRNAVIIEVLVIIMIMFILIYLYYRRVKKAIVDPVVHLTEATNEMVENIMNGQSVKIDINVQNEIGTLARSFEKMDEELIQSIAERTRIAAEKERIGAELDMAKNIQAGQLPSIFPPFPDRPEFDIYASMTPAKEVGGDFYDFFFIDDNHLGLVMADVSGKGVPAALFMMMSKILINNYAMMGLEPHEVLERANNAICQNNAEKMFVTVWFGVLEISTGKITAVNAGHEYPVLKQPDGNYAVFKDKHGFVVGGFENLKYKQYEITLNKGDTLFVYTDGVPEATNADEKLFGVDRLVDVMNNNKDADPEQLLANIHTAVNEFVGEAPQFDDLTMLAIRLNK